ncbi:ankyrin repeat and SOCS box protein 11 isoform X2 [Tachyglossus aculeatus]|uniref:ankyrin repeat and SOCS box protein 11 isoform X2 n=1 Tax=Tachyglossus aculeatus TaxID=9261 RepID=UPI0018F50EB7|nr:ankyrin repeat and SOCS box protein 11 isoform X2 [Tachyglossus aculeatus]
MEDCPMSLGFKNIFVTIFAAFFFFKLLIKVFLALLTHFYIVKGNRKEAARIAEEIYGGDCWADRSPLHEAASQGRLLSLKNLLAQGVNVNLVTINRVSSLHEACLGGHVACTKVLLDHGAYVNGVTVHGVTPLFNACSSGSAACVHLLLEYGAKPQLADHLASPLHEAVKRGHRDCMEILLDNDVNIDQEAPLHGTPLYVACTYQRTDCVRKLLELGANVDLGKWLDTPLHAAARQSSAEVIHLLTDYGASLKYRNSQGKRAVDLATPQSSVEQALLLREDFVCDWSPMHEASIHGRLLSLKKLISQGSGVNLITADRVSPLHEACLGGHPACADVLLKHGAQVNGVTIDWHTPLFNACVSGSVDCLNLLLQHGASPQAVCDLASPIHEAAKRGHVACVESLTSYGVNIDHDIKHLGTPLYVACENQQIACAKKLLESGASANGGRGLDSPLHLAVRNSNTDLVHLLMDFGADTQSKNVEGKRPLELVPPRSSLTHLFSQLGGPLSLLQLCRLCIRKCFGIKQHHRITELLLPEELKRFLLHIS